jgi:hypothetical protein
VSGASALVSLLLMSVFGALAIRDKRAKKDEEGKEAPEEYGYPVPSRKATQHEKHELGLFLSELLMANGMNS